MTWGNRHLVLRVCWLYIGSVPSLPEIDGLIIQIWPLESQSPWLLPQTHTHTAFMGSISALPRGVPPELTLSPWVQSYWVTCMPAMLFWMVSSLTVEEMRTTRLVTITEPGTRLYLLYLMPQQMYEFNVILWDWQNRKRKCWILE